jgi:hypothetical protein
MKLIGRKDVENALLRLDKLTQEEARMAAAELLTITRAISDDVMDVDERVEGVGERIQAIDSRVRGLYYVGKGVRNRVKGVADKVSSVIEGGLFFHEPVPKFVLSPFRCHSDRISDSAAV